MRETYYLSVRRPSFHSLFEEWSLEPWRLFYRADGLTDIELERLLDILRVLHGETGGRPAHQFKAEPEPLKDEDPVAHHSVRYRWSEVEESLRDPTSISSFHET